MRKISLIAAAAFCLVVSIAFSGFAQSQEDPLKAFSRNAKASALQPGQGLEPLPDMMLYDVYPDILRPDISVDPQLEANFPPLLKPVSRIVSSSPVCPGTPTVTYGDKTYDTVLIGTQCWLVQSLDIGTKIPGAQDQSNNGTVEKYCYDNNDANCATYGGLYQWAEAVQYLNGATNTVNWSPVPSNHVQGLCPSGWHIPTNAEWGTLMNYLGGITVAGGKLKEVGLLHFSSPNAGATNESGFTALPGGIRWHTGLFYYLTKDANHWTISSGANPNTDAYYGGATYSIAAATNGQFQKVEGLSVRCLKDLVPSVSIAASANPVYAGTTVIFTATPVNAGTSPSYQWKVNGVNVGTNNVTYSYVPSHGDNVVCEMTLSGGGTAISSTITMTVYTTGVACASTPTVTYGDKIYNTVQIGTQCWLREDLNIGTRINNSVSQTNNGTVEKYCYGDLDANCNTYGGLYQWNEAMGYVTTEGAQGICPAGWHIPTKAETETLSASLGGDNVAGGKMKEAGLAHWKTPNYGATNESGFTVLPGGYSYRYNQSPAFYYLTQYGYFWTTTMGATINDAWYRGFSYALFNMSVVQSYKTTAFSIRCLKNSSTVPSAPTVLTGKFGLFSSWVNLSWTAPSSNGGSPIMDYLIEYKQVSSPTWTVFSHAPSANTTATVTGLTYGNSYDYRVSAINAIGTGPSVAITAPSQVTGVVATPGNGQVTLNWTAPNNGGSPLTNYMIQYKLAGTTTILSTTIIPADLTTKTITGLTNGVSYDFQVRAFGSSAGSWSVVTSSMPIGAPVAPANLAGVFGLFSSWVNLSWTAPSNNGGSPITDYLIEYKQVSSPTWTVFSHTPSANTTATVTGLTYGNSYDYRVSAINAIGTGPSVAITAPSQVTGVVATPGNGQVTLNWTAPNNGGSPLTNYMIQYKLTGTTAILSTTIIPADLTTKTITGLTNGVSYDFQVRAFGSSAGSWSSVVSQAPTTP